MVHVIGAGVAGLAAAIRLAVQGERVCVWESNAYAGGKLSELRLNGYRFDAGPSLFTMPQYVEELFTLANRDFKDYFHYHRLDVCAHYFYEDGTVLHAFADHQAFGLEIEQKTQDKAPTLMAYLAKSRQKYELTHEVFLERSLHKLSNFMNLKTLKSLASSYKLDIFKKLSTLNESHFKDPKLVQLFNRYATYNGSDPYQTSGIMSMIPHFEFGFGTFFPKGGMVAITNSLVNLAKDLGVQFEFNAEVKEVLIQNQKASALRVRRLTKTEDEIVPVKKVLSNMDVTATYHKLLPTQKPPTRLLEQPKSSSGIIFYWGIKKSFSELHLHNLFFSNNYPAEFEAIFRTQTLPQDPTIYLNISSKEEPLDAPIGCENWFVMINTPNNSGQNWQQYVDEARHIVLKKLSKFLKTNISDLIVEEAVLDPRTIESRTRSAQGALYGNSSNNKYAAFLRHANFSKQIPNLFFCGGSVHPGGGIPLCLLSAKIATEAMRDA